MKTTESESLYKGLEKMNTLTLLNNINKEDQKVALAISKCLNQIEELIEAAFVKMAKGGRLFYLGSGTSGRLGILDASECPPTFGVEPGLVIGIIAGGDTAIRTAVENAEDNFDAGWWDLKKFNINSSDFVIGISSSGNTPYVVGALQHCYFNGIETGALTSNLNSTLAKESKYPIEVIVGPEFITGSTRMKSGTAQKMILNMISTTLMIKLGKIEDNKMVDMQLKNKKLVSRGTKIIMDKLGIDEERAKNLLLKYGSVRKAINQSNL
ncbi:MAG: N-acetylmuramic acid 6-phosphate etherase [Bacteroidales bacterium]|nr:N-acetylmuramic acid 6-phosphate etherase [Bacteroidales bacterium]